MTHIRRLFRLPRSWAARCLRRLPDKIAIHFRAKSESLAKHWRKASADKRSYRANFDRISKDLGFKASHTVADAVRELLASFESGKVKSMGEDVYYRVKYLKKHPVENKQAVKQAVQQITG